MYDDSDIDAAVAAGQLSPSNAVALRRFVATRRADPPAPLDDRYFRYTWPIADILPAFAVLFVTAGITAAAWPLLGRAAAVPIAALAWLLSGRFAQRRQALPMTLLCLVFAVAVAASLTAPFVDEHSRSVPHSAGLMIAGGCALACWSYWRCYHLPLAVPLALVALLTVGDHLVALAVPHPHPLLVTGWTLVVGSTMFVAAMWWDASDVYRQTARSDVAFWMHLLAAFLLCAAAVRGLVGVPGAPGWDGLFSLPPRIVQPSMFVVATFLTLLAGAVSLIVDRRALLVIATWFLLAIGSKSGDSMAFSALLLMSGTVLLATTFAWRPLRRIVVDALPFAWRAQLPRLEIEPPVARPVD